MKKCLICGNDTEKPFQDLFRHFHLIDTSNISFLKGTFVVFGFRAALIMISPICNTVINWKHMKYRLKLSDGSEL